MTPNLAEAWIKYYETKDDALFWAFEELSDLVHEQPELAWQSILSISQQSSDPDVLANLAAGPVEDILNSHGEAFIDRFELYTRQHPEFVLVAKGVWCGSKEHPVWARVYAVQSKYS